MNTRVSRLLFWSPRILGLLFAAFLGLFALDVLGAGDSIAQQVGALLIHLTPSCLVLLAVALAWRWERLGASLFFCLGALYMALVWPAPHWSWYAAISGPLFLIGGLFFVDWASRRRPRTAG